MFFATTSEPDTESALPFLNLLDVLTVNNVYRLHLWHKGHPRTNTGKQMFSYQAIDFWRDIPYYLTDLNTFSFAKEIKHYLLSEQYSKEFE